MKWNHIYMYNPHSLCMITNWFTVVLFEFFMNESAGINFSFECTDHAIHNFFRRLHIYMFSIHDSLFWTQLEFFMFSLMIDRGFILYLVTRFTKPKHKRKAYKLSAIIIHVYINDRTNKRRNGKSFIESLIYKTTFFFCDMGVGGMEVYVVPQKGKQLVNSI